jgi:hypothetical protein
LGLAEDAIMFDVFNNPFAFGLRASVDTSGRNAANRSAEDLFDELEQKSGIEHLEAHCRAAVGTNRRPIFRPAHHPAQEAIPDGSSLWGEGRVSKLMALSTPGKIL